MNPLSLLRYALVCALIVTGVGLAQAQQLAPEDAERLGIETVVERSTPAPVAERGGLQVCVDDVLLIPDSINDGVAVHDPATGDLVDEAFIIDPTNLSTPKNAIGNFDGDGVFVIDQLTDGIYEYDCDGNFVGFFAPAGGEDLSILDNAVAITLSPDGSELWAAVTGNANQDAIARFDQSGNYLGNIVANGAGGVDAPFDVLLRDSDILVPAINTDDIHRYDLSGAFLSIFQDVVSALDFPQQANLASNGNVLQTGSFGAAGVYEYDASGTEVGFYDVVDDIPRGIYELPNGNLLVTSSTSNARVSEITRANTLVRTIGTANQYIELFEAPSAGDPIEIDASPDSQSVPQGGTASFSYSVTNNTAAAQSGVVFYEAFRNGNSVAGPVQVVSGTLQADQTQSSSFSVNVPNSALPGNYSIEISAGSSLGNAAATDIVTVSVTANARAEGTAAGWSLDSAAPWSEEATLEADARTAEFGAYPNPLRTETTIQYELTASAEVRLAVYDVLGRTVAVLTEGTMDAGRHAATFDARGLATGTYIYRLQVGDTVQTGRLTVVN